MLLQKSFWLKIWVWCKVNWKFLVGLAIPIAVSIIMRKGRASEIFAKGQEAKAKQLEKDLLAGKISNEEFDKQYTPIQTAFD